MELNEVKKALYKEKPTARLVNKNAVEQGNAKEYIYAARLDKVAVVGFRVPVSEMGETPFDHELPAQLLIRWIDATVDIQDKIKEELKAYRPAREGLE